MSILRKLILASGSPRRKDLLARAGFSFHVFLVKVSENLEKNLTVNDQILAIARRKALASLQAYKPLKDESFLMLSADTMVVLNNEPLGKPENLDQAVDFLTRLSGQMHEVKTAVVLVEGPAPMDFDFSNLDLRHWPADSPIKLVEEIETTQVVFKHLSEKEIREYVETGDCMDKAGAYGIQGAAQNFVERISGSYDNVVGLPMDLVQRMFKAGGWKFS